MWYWIIMILLIGGSIALLVRTYINVSTYDPEEEFFSSGDGRRRRKREGYEYGGEPGEGSEGQPERRRRSSRELEEGDPRRRRRRQWKIILEDADNQEEYEFIFYRSVGIGRGRDGSRYEEYLMLGDDGRISKMHCAIVCRGEKLYLVDENSRNGTYLNGARVVQPILIQKGDVIGVGSSRLEIQRVMRESDQP